MQGAWTEKADSAVSEPQSTENNNVKSPKKAGKKGMHKGNSVVSEPQSSEETMAKSPRKIGKQPIRPRKV